MTIAHTCRSPKGFTLTLITTVTVVVTATIILPIISSATTRFFQASAWLRKAVLTSKSAFARWVLGFLAL